MAEESDGRRVIATDQAPAAIGPYSQAIVANGLVFTAGQIPLDPATMQLVAGDITAQTERVMRNLEAVLAVRWAAGAAPRARGGEAEPRRVRAGIRTDWPADQAVAALATART